MERHFISVINMVLSAVSPQMQNSISVLILLSGLSLALLGAWLLWGPLSVLIVVGAALFAFGLASID